MSPLKLLSYFRNCNISKTAKIYPFSKITNSTINDYSYVSYSCTINNCQIGRFCSIANGTKIGLGKHPIDYISTSPIFYSPNNPLKVKISDVLRFEETAPVKIGNDVWIGANVIILDGITIGNGAIIGANSLVTKDVTPYSIVGGIPAKPIKNRFSDLAIEKLTKLSWWNLPIDFFKDELVKDIFSKKLEESNIEKLINLKEKYLKP